MPIGPTRTKAEKRKVMHTEMHKFSEGDLHSGSKKGPVVKNPKQAIAIGLSESKQSKPKKEDGYDRSGHFPGNPGFKREGKPPYGEYDGGAQAKQPHGKSTGEPPIDKPHGHNDYQGELWEHWGSEASGKEHHSEEPVANVGSEKRGTELVGKTNTDENHKQPHGKSIGAGRKDIAEHHIGHGMGPAHTFKMPKTDGAHGFTGTHKSGFHRVSGHKGAHQVGKR
jgi:hypothetical protein